MKKYIILFLLFFVSISFAQRADDVRLSKRFGAAGGFTPMWIMPNLDELNVQVRDFGLDELSTGGFFGTGGAGFAYVMFVENLRVGGMGFGGSTSQSETVNGINKEVKYSIGIGGFTAEYTLPFINKIAVSPGLVIGGGSIEIDAYRNSENFVWNEVWNELENENEAVDDISREMNNSFFTITPTLNVDIPITRFIAFRVGGGYVLTLGDSWEVENGQELLNVPSQLSGNSFYIQTGIFFGFFAF